MSLPHCLFRRRYLFCGRPFHPFDLPRTVWMTTLATMMAHNLYHLTIHDWLVFYKIPMCLTKIDYANYVLYSDRPTEAFKAKLKSTNKMISLLLLWLSPANKYYYLSIIIKWLILKSVDEKKKQAAEREFNGIARALFSPNPPHFNIGIRCTWEQLDFFNCFPRVLHSSTIVFSPTLHCVSICGTATSF